MSVSRQMIDKEASIAKSNTETNGYKEEEMDVQEEL